MSKTAVEADNHYDLVVAGGGMIGASMALALAPLGLQVAVIERVSRSRSLQPSFDDRSTAISRSTQRMLTAMGVWDEVAAAAAPIRRIHVSEKGRFGFAHIDAREQGVDALGYVIINRVLGDILQRRLQETASTSVICPATVVATRCEGHLRAVTIEDDSGERRDIRCELLAVADGANSAIRGMLGIDSSRVDYGQTAIIGNLLPEMDIGEVAYERFTEQGPLAMLPMAEDRVAFVWTVASADAGRVLDLDDETFLEELQRAFGNRLGKLSRVGRRAAYALTLSKAQCTTAERAVLLGNAAHGLHPVAAQGFNLGMRDVAALCDCIADSRRYGTAADLGAAAVLQRYADWRRADQGKLVRITDGLVRLFQSSKPPVRMLRNLGMLGFDLVPGMRAQFARQMMGLAGRLPRLSRGVPLR